MSSRSLGLLAGFLVSQGMFQPFSCFLMRSGSSVRKRMRPCNLTVGGRFSILRFFSESITQFSCAGVKDGPAPHGKPLNLDALVEVYQGRRKKARSGSRVGCRVLFRVSAVLHKICQLGQVAAVENLCHKVD